MLAALSQVFGIIQGVMQLLHVWNDFLNWMEENNIAIRHEKALKREAAIRAGVAAETEDEIWKGQDDVVKNRPAP